MLEQLKKTDGDCPPDGYVYTHPDGHRTVAWDYRSWVEAARKYIRLNQLEEPTNLEAIIQDQLCKILPPDWCLYSDPNRPIVDMRFSLRDVWNWTEAHLKLLCNNFVEQSEAERRAKICSGCYMNVEGQGCTGCQKVATLFTAELAKRKTQSDPFLKSCAVCKCFNRASVHFPLAILESHDTDELQSMYPSFCWKKKLGENYGQ